MHTYTLNTATPTWQMYRQIYPSRIKHTCLQYHYTKLSRCTGRSTLAIKHRCLQYCYTKLGTCTGRSTPQSSIDAFNTTTPNLPDLPPTNQAYMPLNTATPNLADLLADLSPLQLSTDAFKLLHQTCRSTPHQCQHTCLECCYTKLGRSTGRCLQC